ncbi:MAG TPA: ATPase, T2SS/T4P/T4SS family [Burkholderiales bacterium]|nr:ATPase, T2SS/T4P/T4SS family [Burkholderiales bacterium]
MLRGARNELLAASTPAPRLLWPAPPYYEFVDAVAKGGEPCVLTFADGEKARGWLLGFRPETEELEMQPDKPGDAVTVAFSDLACVRLLRPITVRPERVAIGAAVSAPSARQPFWLKLTNDSALEGETLGHIRALCGIFLFPPEAERKVVRLFVPTAAATQVRIGRPIGELLVDEDIASAESVSEALEKQKALRSRRLGEYLTSNEIVSQEQLLAALKEQKAQPMQKLGETLVELGFLTKAELAEALAIEKRNRSLQLGEILADMGVVDMDRVHSVLAKKLGIPHVNLRKVRPTPEALKRIPAAVASRYRVLPLAETENGLVIAIDDPTQMERMEEVRFAAGTKLAPVVAFAQDIKEAIETAYGVERDFEAAVRRAEFDVGVGELTQRLSIEGVEDEVADPQGAQIDSTLVKLVNKIVLDAVAQNVSDIHIESNAGAKSVRVRFRKDGVLVDYLDIPARFRGAVISRIKIMCQLDIAERRKPQDGKIPFKRFGPADVELRVATIPTSNGLEDVVMRVLAAAVPKRLEELGLDADTLERLRRVIARPHGMVLVCGPTGSGKTTTLHSLLSVLNTGEKKIWTAEDPIEITQPGLRQVQVNPKIGWTFATALRSLMRADPDVIMVGEMRDAETARIGVEASLTGHLVLSTLHTNSAPESVVRLLDLGMDPFNFADSLLAVLSQRLVRKLCVHCRIRHEPKAAEIEALAAEYGGDTSLKVEDVLKRWRQEKIAIYTAKGCRECDRTGYRGRTPIWELMVADRAIKRLIQKRAPLDEIVAAALAGGMRTLKQDGIERVLQGVTDLAQVRAI